MIDIEAIIRSAAGTARREHGLRVPLTVAAVCANGSCVVTRFTAAPPGHPPGAVVEEHVAGHVEADGLQTPIHLLVTDCTARALLLVQRPTASVPVVLPLAPEE
jgi:hypothetical protein